VVEVEVKEKAMLNQRMNPETLRLMQTTFFGCQSALSDSLKRVIPDPRLRRSLLLMLVQHLQLR
jgi:hypothetical protein